MSGFANMREQFDTLKAENDPLKNQLDAANQEISRQKDWMEKAAMLWFDNTSKISELERQFNLKTLMLTIIFHMEKMYVENSFDEPKMPRETNGTGDKGYYTNINERSTYLENKLHEAENRIKTLTDDYNKLVKRNKMLFKENNEVKRINAKLETDIASISSAFDDLRNSSIDSTHEIEDLKHTQVGYESTIKDLKGALVEHKRKIENTANLYKEFEVKNNELESENIKLKEDVENFKQYYEAMQFHYKMLYEDYRELEEECNRLKALQRER